MTFTLAGTVKSPTSVVLSGTARVTPLAPILDTANNFVFTGPVSTSLSSGAFSFTLPDSSIATGYQLEVLDATGTQMFAPVTFGAGAPSTTLDLSDLINTTPVVAVPTTYTAVINYSGSGRPEGVVTASVGSRYVDTAATTGAVEWLKASGAGNTGWKVVYGDTGWRLLDASFMSNGWAVYFTTYGPWLRRVNNHVMLLGRIDGTAATSSNDAITLPTGFRISLSSGNWFAYVGGSPALGKVRADGTIDGVTTGAVTSLDARFFTDDAWPSTLPGTAAT